MIQIKNAANIDRLNKVNANKIVYTAFTPVLSAIILDIILDFYANVKQNNS